MQNWQALEAPGVTCSVQATDEGLEVIGHYHGSLMWVLWQGCWVLAYLFFAGWCTYLDTYKGVDVWSLGVIALFGLGFLFPFVFFSWAWTALRRHGEMAYRLQVTREVIMCGPPGTTEVLAFHDVQAISLDTHYALDGGMGLGAPYLVMTLHLADGRHVVPPGNPEPFFAFMRQHFHGPMRHDGKEVVAQVPPAA